MSVGSAARRSRRGQLIALMLVVASLVGTSAFTVLAVQSIQRGLVYARAEGMGAIGRLVSVQRADDGDAIGGAQSPTDLDRLIDGRLKAATGDPVLRYRATVRLAGRPDLDVELVEADGACAHLTTTSGRCPSAAGEIALGAAQASSLAAPVGTALTVEGSGWTTPLRVVGIHAPAAGEYWTGYSIDAVTVMPPNKGNDRTQVVVAAGTLSKQPGLAPGLSVERFLDPTRLDPATLASAIAGAEATRATVARSGSGLELRETVATVDDRVRSDLGQIAVIVPLLTGQMLLLLLVMGALVTRAVVDDRRHELAVARIRGLGSAGGRRLVLSELWPAYLAALPAGLAAAYAADEVVRRWWLPGHLGARWSGWAVLAGVAGAVVAALVLLLTLEPVVRAQLLTLLRRTAPRRSGLRVGPAEVGVGVLAVAGLVAVATHSLTGPATLLTPFLAAVLLGVVASALVGPVAGRMTARRLAAGSLTSGLVLTQLARRPAARQVILALVIATTLVVFAAASVAAGSQNRERRAQVESGAAAVLTAASVADPVTPQDLVAALDSVDPGHRTMTPVVRVSATADWAPTVMAVVPQEMARIANPMPAGPIPWQELTGRQVAIVQGWSSASGSASVTAPLVEQKDGDYRIAGEVPLLPTARAQLIATDLNGQSLRTDRSTDMTLEVWTASTDPHVFDRLRAALGAKGFDVLTVRTRDQRLAELDASAPAWGMQLGLVVAVGSALVALLVLLTVLSSTAVSRRADATALARSGVPVRVLRRALVGEQLVLVAIGVGLGLVAGLVGSALSFPLVPWFSTQPTYPLPLVGLPWRVLVPIVLGLVLLLVTAAWGAGRWIARTATSALGPGPRTPAPAGRVPTTTQEA